MAEVERHTQRRGAAVANLSRSIWLDFAIFTRTLCGTRSPQTFSEQGDTYGVTGDARPFKRGDYAAIFGLDGQMAACFERLRWRNIIITEYGPDFSHSFRVILPIYNASVLTRTLRLLNQFR